MYKTSQRGNFVTKDESSLCLFFKCWQLNNVICSSIIYQKVIREDEEIISNESLIIRDYEQIVTSVGFCTLACTACSGIANCHIMRESCV